MFPELVSHSLSALIHNNPHQISRWPNTFSSSAPNAKPKKISAIEVNCVLLLLLLMCWCDIRAAQQSSTKSFICAGKCVRESDRQQVPGVPGQCCGPSCPPTPSCSRSPSIPPSLSCSLTVLYSHLITFEQRHAVLFIGEWCFFICLCLFVALRSTEGFLAADVSSAALQRDGWNAREKRGKKGRRKETKWQKGETKEG